MRLASPAAFCLFGNGVKTTRHFSRKARGFILYPGKLTQVETYRVGCIGAIGPNEMRQAVDAVADTLREMGIPSGAPAL